MSEDDIEPLSINSDLLLEDELTIQNDGSIKTKKGFHMWLYISICLIGTFLFGYDIGVIAGGLILLQHDFQMNDFHKQLIVSAVVGGAMIGSILGIICNDYLGRWKSLLISVLGYIIGALLLGFSPTSTLLFFVAGRLVVGLSIGIGLLATSVYIAEVSTPKYRGALISTGELVIVLGIFVSFLVNAGLSSQKNNHQAWRWSFGLSGLPALVQLLGMFIIPESPRWLVYKGRNEEARAILIKLRNAQNVEEEMNDIKESKEPSFGKLLTSFIHWTHFYYGQWFRVFQSGHWTTNSALLFFRNHQ
eukprot:TRINITY_DN3684_c0_g1_i5.p1 TRINITY_DN3684_c0_g1~~TRINITY_DN3684_c0_g1_i5.p1  ORF type:complete len:313 (-),score=38.13 TRINITY_DN3684_c0_g1_i5:580-1491(-)